ncbi:MAG: alpha/beta hydrolase family protein, partial [Acidimicrobiales bacterium]
AHALLRDQSGVDPERVGLHCVSQGGWVSYLAASMAPATVRQVVAISGPGVSAAKQERHRLAVLVDDDEEALAWVDERTERLIAGDDPESILADQLAHSDRPWYRVVCDVYVAEWLPFFARNAAFDPATVLPDVRCPVFAAFGGADATVPVPQSISRLIELLPPNPRHAFAVFPNAGHSLCVGQRDSAIPLAEQLAPGFLPMLSEWFATC